MKKDTRPISDTFIKLTNYLGEEIFFRISEIQAFDGVKHNPKCASEILIGNQWVVVRETVEHILGEIIDVHTIGRGKL